ncbi:unnamed protein product [Closterium sp. NIES-65]|nr:unnamed protein product [Closterium sp. NIES-65]
MSRGQNGIGHGTERSVWSIGCGLGGKLGHGTNKDDSHGSRGKLRPAVKACHVAAGDYTTFVVGEGGEVWSFGSAESACLGHGGGWEREEEEEGEEIDDVDLHDIVVSSVVGVGSWVMAAAAPEAQPGCDAAQADVSELLIPLLLLPLLHSLSLTLPTSPTFSQLRQHRRRNRDVMQPRRVSLLEERATRFSYPSCSSLSLTLPTPPTFSQLRQHRRRNRDVMQPRRVSLLEERAAHPPAPLPTAPAPLPTAPAPAPAAPAMNDREDGRQGGWAAGRLGGREVGRQGGLRGDWQAL